MKNAIGIIPARYLSSRFPGKLLARLQGKPVIQWTYEGAIQAKKLKKVIIATDDWRIKQACQKFGASVVMTSSSHSNGTERIAEVAKDVKENIIINIQGDEILIDGKSIDLIVSAFETENVQIASLMFANFDLSQMEETDRVKVVVDKNNNALYFSRVPIPWRAAIKSAFFTEHIGVYGYHKNLILSYAKKMRRYFLEKTECLEQLRFLENGFQIKMIEAGGTKRISINSKEDIKKAELYLSFKQKVDK